jgi:predicted DNA-binding protein with PD1-like motif
MALAAHRGMRAKLLHDDAGERTFAVIFDTGEDPVAGLTRFAEEHNITAASFTAIGAFSEAMLGYFDWEKKDYEKIPLREQVEVLALVGDIAVEKDDCKKLHAHVVLGRRDGTACGGHLLSAKVRPTLEVIVNEAPGYLQREHDPETGLTLIRWSGPAARSSGARSR